MSTRSASALAFGILATVLATYVLTTATGTGIAGAAEVPAFEPPAPIVLDDPVHPQLPEPIGPDDLTPRSDGPCGPDVLIQVCPDGPLLDDDPEGQDTPTDDPHDDPYQPEGRADEPHDRYQPRTHGSSDVAVRATPTFTG